MTQMARITANVSPTTHVPMTHIKPYTAQWLCMVH